MTKFRQCGHRIMDTNKQLIDRACPLHLNGLVTGQSSTFLRVSKPEHIGRPDFLELVTTMLFLSCNCKHSVTILLCLHHQLTPWNWNGTLLGGLVWCLMVKIFVEDIQMFWILYCTYKLCVHFFLEIGFYDFNWGTSKLRINDAGRNVDALCCAIHVNMSSRKTINDALIPPSPL